MSEEEIKEAQRDFLELLKEFEAEGYALCSYLNWEYSESFFM